MAEATVGLAAGDYRLTLAPARGGAIADFAWGDAPLLRATCGPSILDTGCFPLVPFSNRIAHGRFRYDGRDVTLPPNFPGAAHPHPLHGMGWLATWEVVEASATSALLRHDHAAGAWPWRYRAEQRATLDDDGLSLSLSVENRDTTPMPAGLGLHPYFPLTSQTVLRARHRGEWDTGADGLPRRLDCAPTPVDWWSGRPVATRNVDTVYADRDGPIEIEWPERALTLRIAPDEALRHTVVYTPPGADFFCVEPVSHATDALNRPDAPDMRRLAPGERFTVTTRFSAYRH